MERKLFCSISPFTYRISVEKGRFCRALADFPLRGRFAVARETARLPVAVYRHGSLIRRRLGNVDMALQENKAINLALAAPLVDGVLIRPGETFSFWRLVGNPTGRRGFREGLTLSCGGPSSGIGGGMCQFTNLIHWMVLHSDLEITEHHHHDGVDLFPDFNRQIPFGTGTSIFYNYLDYRFYNPTSRVYQLCVRVDGEYLRGELRADAPQAYCYHIVCRSEFFSREADGVYRNNELFRRTVDRATGCLVGEELFRRNHARVAYSTDLLGPQRTIRQG